MPHVVLKGEITVEDLWFSFQPLELTEDGVVFKATECFLSADKRTALVRSLVVEREFPRNFFLKIVTNDDDTLMLCMEKLGQTERAGAVKRFIGLCAWQILQSAPEVELGTSNIADLVAPPKGA